MHKVLAIHNWLRRPGTFFLYIVLVFGCTNLHRRSAIQSQSHSNFQIHITHSTEVSTAIRTSEDDTRPSYVVAVSPFPEISHLPPPPPPSPTEDLRPDQYTLIRLSNVGSREVWKRFNGGTELDNRVPHIEELVDESWELIVLKSYRLSFRERLEEMFAGSKVDLNYDPLEPIVQHVKLWGYGTAKELAEYSFLQRAKRILKDGSPAARGLIGSVGNGLETTVTGRNGTQAIR